MKTICEQLGIEVEPGKPFIIRDENGDEIYFESSDGYWWKRQVIDNNKIYYENSYGVIEVDSPKTLTMDGIIDMKEVADKIRVMTIGCGNQDVMSCEFGNEFGDKVLEYLNEIFGQGEER